MGYTVWKNNNLFKYTSFLRVIILQILLSLLLTSKSGYLSQLLLISDQFFLRFIIIHICYLFITCCHHTNFVIAVTHFEIILSLSVVVALFFLGFLLCTC